MSNASNGLLKFITCGSVDDGKSTLIGHILYDSKLLYADQKQSLLLDSQVGSREGKIDYSLLLDGLMAEREQSITIDVAYRYFTTDHRSFIVADTPGHEEYTRNMAVGASFADLAIILVDASQGILVQTRRHVRICALMGIQYFVFAVNKMDLVDYSKERFEALSKDIKALCSSLNLENIVIIPLSATEGDNITVYSENMKWYTGSTLLNHLETVSIDAEVSENGFYMPIQRVCRPNHAFRGFQGQIESGIISVDDEIMVLPSREIAKVQSIHVTNQRKNSAAIGQAVTIQLDREIDVSRGCVLEKEANLKTAKTFSATILWMSDQDLTPGNDFWIKVGTKLLPAVISKIDYKIDVNDGSLLPIGSVSKNEIIHCEISLAEAIIIDEFHRHKTLGELILIDRINHATAACGVIEAINTQKKGIFLSDNEQEIQIYLFDTFYYSLSMNTILRIEASSTLYPKGAELPLQTNECCYPKNFDLLCAQGVAVIRENIFTGFESRNESYPLLNEHGIEIQADGTLGAFNSYRIILVKDR